MNLPHPKDELISAEDIRRLVQKHLTRAERWRWQRWVVVVGAILATVIQPFLLHTTFSIHVQAANILDHVKDDPVSKVGDLTNLGLAHIGLVRMDALLACEFVVWLFVFGLGICAVMKWHQDLEERATAMVLSRLIEDKQVSISRESS